jgi:predicted regulator of Ras-like GTPase activity (Roadblock/LC7/MglB family)
MRYQPPATDPITEELQLIRQNVPGVRGSITATSDGLLVAHDMHGLEPTQVAALVAATHAVAVRASLSTECGQLKEVITRGADGYLAVYAAERSGGPVIVAVLGTSELNVAMLNFQARKMIERIAEHSAGLAREPRADSAVPAPPARDDGPAGDQPLPARRRPGRKPGR